MLVARGADTQLGSSCVSAPLATNVDLWNPIWEFLLSAATHIETIGPSSHEFRLAVKLGIVSGYVFDSKHFTRNICVLTIKMSTNIPMVSVSVRPMAFQWITRLCWRS